MRAATTISWKPWALLKPIDGVETKLGKYNVTVHGGHGGQVGYGNTQINTFG